MGILSWIIFGLIAGSLARWLTPGKGPKGCLVTIGLGIAGAVVGGFLGTQLGFGTVAGFDLRSFIIAVIGAALLLAGYQLLSKDK